MRRVFIAVIAVVATVVAPVVRSAEALVGVQRLVVVDESRPSICAEPPCRLGRQIPVLLFYPAAQATAQRATFEQLGDIGGGPAADLIRRQLDDRGSEMLEYVARKYALGDAKTVTERIERSLADATLDAPPATGRHPLLVYAGGANFMVQENVTLWRAIAANGYVVAAIPTIGARSVAFSADAEGLEVLARDMEAVLAHVHSLPIVDDRKLGLLGFSYGGAAAILAAMRGPAVSAVVGFDASFISRIYGKALAAAPQFSPDRFSAALLDLHARGSDVTEDIVEMLRYSQRRSIEIPGAEHIDFTQMPEVALAEFGDRPLPLRSLAQRAQAHRWFVAETLHFLDGALKDKAGAPSSPLPPGWLESERAGLPLPPTPAELVDTARRQGFDIALRRLRAIEASDPAAALLGGGPLNDFGYSVQKRDPWSALAAFRLNLAVHPKRAEYWDSLADGFLGLDDKACAGATYRAELAMLAAKSQLTETDRAVQETAQKFVASAPAGSTCNVELPQ